MNHRGVYATNGALLTIMKRSSVARAANEPADLFIFGLPGNFRGYEKGYSSKIQHEEVKGKPVENHRRFTWAILKGGSLNEQLGTVTLRSNHPLHRPIINFNYFDNSPKNREKDGWQKDLTALAEGTRFAMALTELSGLGATIIWPKKDDLGEKELKEFIKRESWGHHACGTCKIGADQDKGAVLDTDFRLRGVKNLRVVDASVFPRIPGLFIVTSIYMVSEKASDVILNYHKGGRPGPWPVPAGD
jgi:choline dehydrogenase